MGEVDYQIALLLQHQFEQELKKPKQYESDMALARSLQEQFQKEEDVDNPDGILIYYKKKDTKKSNFSKSLTDPSWEVIDPTPDIHMLFIAFNQRFFWNKLLAVCVSWSKRMTKCAGICSYQGKGGLCSVTLSEPLLKLRPRKDLVETLLHEMIHAYLFVTNNNRDRDGHGPEFHKHMYRINSEAGTNITVYHDFHDEVRLYQQHWWRCNGPCQNWKPYFGMVRRAMNRAPGPYDRWWSEHSKNCGGNFIKVKEPENLQKKHTKSVSNVHNKKPKEDIRNFYPTSVNNSTNVSTVVTRNNNDKSNELVSNIHTISNNDYNNSKVSEVLPSKNNNIFGFTNFNGNSSNALTSGVSSTFGKNYKGNAVKNNSSTVVITKKTNTITSNDIEIDKPSFTKPGRVLSESSINNSGYLRVRNHWASKYPSSSNKRGLPQDSLDMQRKIPKLSTDKFETLSLSECPVCLQQIPIVEINDHLDKCLKSSEHSMRDCIICGKKLNFYEYDCHINKCAHENLKSDDYEDLVLKKCNFCQNGIDSENYDHHVLKCSKNKISVNFTEKKCTVCEKIVSPELYDSHVEKCLLKMYDHMEADDKKHEEKVDCLVCDKTILKSELTLHLDDCKSLSRIFHDDNEPKEEIVDSNVEKGNKYNCPICMKLISEHKMNAHVDFCLNNVVSSTNESDISIFRECFNDDF